MAFSTYVGSAKLTILSLVSLYILNACTMNASIADLSSNGVPFAKLVNVPAATDSAVEINIGVTGDSVRAYVYKIGVAGAVDCTIESDYSTTKDIGAVIADSLGALPDGNVKLCVLGINGRGIRQGLDSATVAEWIKDTIPPVVTLTSPVTFVDANNKTIFPLSGACSEDGKPVFIEGAVQTTATCTAGVWSLTLDLSSIPDGPVSFQAKQVDLAKNQNSVTLSGIDKDEGAAAEVSVASMYSKVAEGNQNLAFSIKTSVVKQYDSVISYTLGGDAVAGIDYDFSAGAITIPAGQTTASVNIAIKENVVVDTVKRLTISLVGVNKSNVHVGAQSSKVIEITDNDSATEKTIIDFVAGGGNNTCVIYSTGSLKCWGENTYGQLGDGTNTTRTAPVSVNSAELFKKVFSGGGPSTCAQTTGDKIMCWGWGSGGQLGNGSTAQQLSPVFVDSGAIYPIVDTGGGQNCAINASSKLRCWGMNGSGQVGDNSTTSRSSPVNVDSAENYQYIGLGYEHSCAITTGGVLKCWGKNDYGQLGDNSLTNSSVPKIIDASVSYKYVAGGSRNTCAITTTGILKCWGDNSYGQLGIGSLTASLVPVVVDSGVSYSYVDTAFRFGYSVCGITTTGILKCWGNNSTRMVGDGGTVNRTTPAVIDAANTYSKVSITDNHACALTTTNALLCWGNNQFGQSYPEAQAKALVPSAVVSEKTWKSLARGYEATCAIDSNDKLFCWGKNSFGQVGDGTNFIRSAPVPVMSDKTFVSVSTSKTFSCAISSVHKLYCWGENVGGIGDGTLSKRWSPVLIDSSNSYSKVAVGDSFACAITLAGILRCWGSNYVGQLGDSTTTARIEPTTVFSNSIFKYVSAGLYAACAIDSNDKLFCWGYNRDGQIGDNSTVDKLIPTAIDAGNSYKVVSTDSDFNGTTCGITMAGVLKCWGYNGGGQLGDGTTTSRRVPTIIHSGTSYKMINVGFWSTCGVTMSDKVYCWGNNSSGQLGDGTMVDKLSPTAIDSTNNYLMVELDSDAVTCGLRTNGAMYCWGNKEYGFFANGMVTVLPTPAYKINY